MQEIELTPRLVETVPEARTAIIAHLQQRTKNTITPPFSHFTIIIFTELYPLDFSQHGTSCHQLEIDKLRLSEFLKQRGLIQAVEDEHTHKI